MDISVAFWVGVLFPMLLGRQEQVEEWLWHGHGQECILLKTRNIFHSEPSIFFYLCRGRNAMGGEILLSHGLLQAWRAYCYFRRSMWCEGDMDRAAWRRNEGVALAASYNPYTTASFLTRAHGECFNVRRRQARRRGGRLAAEHAAAS